MQVLTKSCCEDQEKAKQNNRKHCLEKKYQEKALLLHLVTAGISNIIITGILYL